MSKNKTPKRFNSAKEAIKYHEGFKDTAYPDGKTKQGKQLYSIGYGFNDSGAKPNIASRYLEARKSMSQEYADRLLDDYILELKGTLSQYLGYERYKGLTEGQLIAFLDTGYQNPAAMKRAATLYKKGDKEGAANALRVEGFEERNEDRRAAFLDKYSPRINNTSLIDPSMPIYDALRQAGVRFNTSNPSGYRTKEQHSRFSSGENSWHRHLREDGKTAWALDITPDFSRGATWETLQYELTQNGLPEYFAANGLAVLDETDPAIKKRTGATGDHYHIGKDRIAHKKGTYKGWVTKYSGQGNKYNGYTEGASGGYNPYVNYGDQAEQESPDSPRNNDNNKTFYEYIHAQNNGGNTQVPSSKQQENRNIFSDIRKLNAPTQNTEAKNDLFNPTEGDSPYVAEYKETAQKSKNTYDAVKALSHNLNLVNALNNIIEKQEQEAQLEQQSLLPMEWLTNQDSTIAAFGGNLFEQGGPKGKQGKVYRKLNEQDLKRNGWSWGPSNNVREKDPLYEDTIERFRPDENILFDSNGMAVPKSSVYKYLDYEGQLPYQPAQDINDEIRLAKVKSRLKPIGETLRWEHPIIASVLNIPAAIKNIIDARNDYYLSRDIMFSANIAQIPNWRPVEFSRPSQFLILPELINAVAYPSYRPKLNNPAESTFLLSDENARDEVFLDAGYTGKNFSDYGLVNKAVNGRNLPVWQVAKDAIPRDSLTVLGNVDNRVFMDPDKFLPDAGGYFPSAIYADKKGHLYQKIWDLNDYGGTGGATSGILGSALDAIGHPVVLTTGFQRIPREAEGAAVSSLKNIPNNYKAHKIIKDIQSKYFKMPENYKNLGGNLFESGGSKDNGKYTDDFMHQYGLDWTPFSQLYSGDPYYSKIREHELATSNGKEGKYATNAEGRYVPVSELNKLWNDYLLTQPQVNNKEELEVAKAQQHRQNQEFNRQVDNFFTGNWLFPSQFVGAAARGITGDDRGFWNNWLLGNAGVVTDSFAQEHPYWSAAANLAFDVLGPNVKGLTNVIGKGVENLNLRAYNSARNRIRRYQMGESAKQFNKDIKSTTPMEEALRKLNINWKIGEAEKTKILETDRIRLGKTLEALRDIATESGILFPDKHFLESAYYTGALEKFVNNAARSLQKYGPQRNFRRFMKKAGDLVTDANLKQDYQTIEGFIDFNAQNTIRNGGKGILERYPLDSETVSYFENVVIPRNVQTLPYRWELNPATGTFTDKGKELASTQKNFIKDIEEVVVTDDFVDKLFPEGTTAGFTGKGYPKKIMAKEGYRKFAKKHEVEHQLDYNFPLNDKQLKIKESAYGEDFRAPSEDPNSHLYKYDLEAEERTTNLDARRALFNSLGVDESKIPPAEQNAIIEKASPISIYESLKNSNGYGRAFAETLDKKYNITGKYRWVDGVENLPKAKEFESRMSKIKEAFKQLGAYTGISTTTALAATSNQKALGGNLYSEGGGYQDWKKRMGSYKGIPMNDLSDYMYNDFYFSNPPRAWVMLGQDPRAHFTDEFKTVYHPTFSIDSRASGKYDPRYNPFGYIGGRWEDNTFYAPQFSPVSMDERMNYLVNSEEQGARLKDYNGESIWLDDGSIFGPILPNINVTSSTKKNKK